MVEKEKLKQTNPVMGALTILTIIAWIAFGVLAMFLGVPETGDRYTFIVQELIVLIGVQTVAIFYMKDKVMV